MKKIFCCICLQLLLLNFGKAQNQAVGKIIIPAKPVISFTRPLPANSFHQSFNNKSFFNTPASTTNLLFFNDEPLLKFSATAKKQLTLQTRLSFADVLETSVNSIKSGLVNTYDDNIDELFKDAPSWVQLTCIISL